MNLVKEVCKNIKRAKLNTADKVVLAVSGGIDSVVLLDIFSKIFRKEKIIVAHLNHGIRDDSNLDKIFVKNLALRYGLKFASKDAKNLTNKKGNLEKNARDARYEFLYKVARKYKSNLIVTAHHGDDQLETVIMNNLRGSFLEGFIGMQNISKSTIDQDCFIFRPMLDILKSNIFRYQIENSLEFRQDETNFDTKFTRNKIRKLVLGNMTDDNKLLLLKEIKNLGKGYSVLTSKVDKIFKKSVVKERKGLVILDRELINKLKESLVREVIKKSIISVINNLQNISFVNIGSVTKAIRNNITGKEIHLQNNLYVLIDRNYVIFTKKQVEYPVIKAQKLTLGVNRVESIGLDILVTESGSNNKNVMCLDAGKIKFPMYIKSYKDGMKIKLKNVGTKKLQDFFVDKKIERRLRKSFPVLVDAKGELLAIIDLAVSEYCLPDRKTVKYLFIGVKNKN